MGLAAVLSVTAGGAVAVFAAGEPGENLSPIDGAELMVDLTQVNGSVLWSSLAGPVVVVETRSRPTDDGVHQLGGALVIERPANGLAGTINLGETPQEIRFTLS